MVWNAKGDERVKGFKLYQELEATHHEVLQENRRLVAELEQKNELIRRLAAELSIALPKQPPVTHAPPASGDSETQLKDAGPGLSKTAYTPVDGMDHIHTQPKVKKPT